MQVSLLPVHVMLALQMHGCIESSHIFLNLDLCYRITVGKTSKHSSVLMSVKITASVVFRR